MGAATVTKNTEKNCQIEGDRKKQKRRKGGDGQKNRAHRRGKLKTKIEISTLYLPQPAEQASMPEKP